MKILRFSILVALALFAACTSKNNQTSSRGPEETVKAFVELSATATDTADRRRLQDLCQGELRRTFERMTDEAFKLLYMDSKIKILEMKVADTKVDSDKATVGYSVTVENNQGTDQTKEVNEREVELVRAQGTWFIESIRMKGNDRVAFTRGMIF